MIQAHARIYPEVDRRGEPVSQLTLAYRRKRTTIDKGGLLSSVVMYIVLFSVAAVFLYVQGALMGYKVVGLKARVNELETQNKRLEYKIAQLSSLDRIAYIAETHMGMCKPEEANMVAVIGESRPVPVIRTETRTSSEPALSFKTVYEKLLGALGKNRLLGMANSARSGY